MRAILGALPFAFASACLALLPACGGGDTPPPNAPPAALAPAPTATAPAAPTAAQEPAPPAQTEAAHKFLVLTASCWFGGVWSDAEGQEGEMKKAAIDSRCHEVARELWGTDDQTHVEQLRAIDTPAVGDFVAKVDSLAKSDPVDGPRRDNLVKLATALADAQKEMMLARRAGERVKRDDDREPDKLSADEAASVAPLRAHDKLQALLTLDAGDLKSEAHAMGILLVMDRVNVSREMQRHLKVYVLGDAFQILFGAAPPPMPADATTKLPHGAWLGYLVDVAKAAGYPVPATAKTDKTKHALAWGGMLQGIADKLKPDTDAMSASTELAKVAMVVMHRLSAEYDAQKTAAATPAKK
jgi:hypothetical protein